MAEQGLALLGSSHVTRFPDSVLQGLDYRVMKKFGIPGAKTTDISEKLLDEVLAFHPSVCLIMLGGNDLDSCPDNLNLKSIVDNFMRIINRLQGNEIKVVVSEVFYRENCRFITPEHYQKLRSLISKRLCKALGKCGIVYVHFPGVNRSSFRTDLIHLNHGGYKSITHTLKNFI